MWLVTQQEAQQLVWPHTSGCSTAVSIGTSQAGCSAQDSLPLMWRLTSRQVKRLPSVAREKFGTIEMSSSPAKNSTCMSDRRGRALSEGCMVHNEKKHVTAGLDKNSDASSQVTWQPGFKNWLVGRASRCQVCMQA